MTGGRALQNLREFRIARSAYGGHPQRHHRSMTSEEQESSAQDGLLSLHRSEADS